MDYAFSEEQKMLQKAVRDFLVANCPTKFVREMEQDEKGYSPKLWQEMAELGWMGLAFPEKYGGSGRSFLDLAILLHEMGRAMLPGPFLSSVVLGGLPILDAGSEEQKAEYLPKIATGEAIFTLALTEPSASYDAASIEVRATATADDEGYILNGTKLFVPDAHVANYLLCVARTNEQATAEKGITIFIVDAKSPGIRCKVRSTMSSDKLCEVVFDQVQVDRKNILGQPDHGWDQVQKIIQQGAVAQACGVAGILRSMMEMTVAYVKKRVRWNRPIGSFQIIQHECARMLVDVDGAWVSSYQAAWRLSEGLPCVKEVAVAKAWMSQAGERTCRRAHQMIGTTALTRDYDLQLYTRRAKAAQSTFGDADFYRSIVARQMLD